MKRSPLFFTLLLFSIAVAFGGQSCSSSSITPGAKVSPAEDVTFAAEGVEVSIPAGTFEKEMTFTLEGGEGIVAISDLKSAYDIFSSPIRLRFSEAQLAQTSAGAQISLSLSDAIGDGAVYALVRVFGKQSEFGGNPAEGSNTWRPVFTRREDKKLLLDLFASAERIDIVAVFPKGQEVTKALSQQVSAQKKTPPAKQQNAGDQNWNDRPWIIYCDLVNIPVPFNCDEQAMVDIAREFSRASQFLKQLGLTNGLLHQTSLGEARARYGPFVFSDDPDENASKNFAIVGSMRCAREYGCYDTVFHTIYISVEAFGVLAPVIAHELVHVVQGASSPAVALDSPTSPWIWEGSADAVAVLYDNAALQTLEGMRDWKLSLNSRQSALIPYQTYLFFVLANDGDLSYLAPFFNNVAASPRSYRAAEGGIVASLADLFDVVLAKVYMALFDNDFIDCGPEEIAPGGGDMTVNMERVSEQCVNMKSDDGRCIALTFGDQLGPNNGVFIVNGVGGLPPGELIKTNAEAVQIQIIDVNSVDEVAPPTALSVTTNLYECEDTLTGVWCSNESFPPNGPLPWLTHKLSLQQNENVVSGMTAIRPCEGFMNASIGQGQVLGALGENVSLALADDMQGVFPSGCRDGIWPGAVMRYDLRRESADRLVGTFTSDGSQDGRIEQAVDFTRCQ